MTIIYVPIRFSNADNWGHLKRVRIIRTIYQFNFFYHHNASCIIKLKFDAHVAKICRRVSQKVAVLRRMKKMLPCETRM